jgi:hypothetical protein
VVIALAGRDMVELAERDGIPGPGLPHLLDARAEEPEQARGAFGHTRRPP